MGEKIRNQISELEQAIAAQDNLRPILGDDVVNMTIATLHEKLALLQPSFSEERKLLTCLFCDVVGSTRMAADRDPEEVLNIIDGALREMSASVDHFGGIVGRYMGDGILAIFGAPRALERHAQQAILAGLDIQDRMAVYAAFVRQEYRLVDFKVRVGINSGHVVAGQIAGAKGEYTVIGDAVNITSRFEAAAPPGGIMVGETTFRLAGGDALFQAKALPPIKVKGANRPLSVYLIEGAVHSPSGTGISAISRAPLTGRDGELNALKEKYFIVRDNNQPQVAVVIGPAGIGKSRLREEFVGWLSANVSSANLWMGRTFSYERHTPYGLARDLLRAGLEISDVDKASERMAKLEAGWSAAGDLSREHLHGLAAILAVRYEDDTLSQLEPKARRMAIFEAFTQFCARRAKNGSLVLILEDTHWADDLSLEVLEHLVNSLPNAPIFMLILTRPVTDPGARALEIRSRIGPDVYSEVTLDELSLGEAGQMVHALLKTSELPGWLTDAIADKAQGNPFFIEEIVNTFVEDGTLAAKNGGWIVTRDSADIQVPDTVQAVLAARIDRLDPELKHVIQYAAIVGRIFWQQLLTSLIGEDVDDRLNALANQDFVLQKGRAALVEDWEWIFRHVLVQEVAYDSVLKESRRQVHYQIADWLEENSSDRLDELAPSLARHFELGQIWDKAIVYLEAAADQSRNLFALHQAIRFYDQAIILIEQHPAAVEKQTALRIQESRGEMRGLAGEFAMAVEDLSEVLLSARSADDTEREQKLLISLGMIYRRADDYERAMGYLNQALEVARASGAKRATADALYHLGSVAWSEGNNVQSTTYHEEAVQICRDMELMDLVAVQALHGRGEAYWFSGNPQVAIEYLTESLELARSIGDKSYESENLQMIGFMHNPNYGTATTELALQYASESLEISQKAHMDWHTIPALLTLAPPRILAGEYDQALKTIKQANFQAESIGSLRMLSIGLDYLGHLYQELNMLAEAADAHKRGQEIAIDIGSNFWLPRLRANLLIDRMRMGDLTVGLDLESVFTEAKERDQIAHAVRALEGLAELAILKEDPSQAGAFAAELRDIARSGGLRDQIIQAYRWLGEAHILAGDYPEAAAALENALQLARDIGAPRRLWEIHSSFSQLYLTQGLERAAAEQKEKGRQILIRIAENLGSPELHQGLPID